ncbi:MAG: alpha/beta hydrolase [Rhodoglobus sp.]
MDMDAVNPDLRRQLARLPPLDPSKAIVRFIGTYATTLMPRYRVPGVTTRWIRDAGIRARVHEPAGGTSGPCLLWFHGGGLVLGSPLQDDRLCVDTAVDLGITVIAAAYRLAPKAPFPAGLDDALAAWEWVQSHASGLGIDPTRVVVGGESAGGSIAASLAQRLHDSGGVQPVAQWLFTPMLDDRTAAKRELDAIDHPVWNNRANHYGWGAYLGTEPGGAEVAPHSVPARRADLSGLPPAWLSAGDIELFHDEIVDYAARLRSADVSAELDVVPGGAHGFESWAPTARVSVGLLDRARKWLATAVGVERAARV